MTLMKRFLQPQAPNPTVYFAKRPPDIYCGAGRQLVLGVGSLTTESSRFTIVTTNVDSHATEIRQRGRKGDGDGRREMVAAGCAPRATALCRFTISF